MLSKRFRVTIFRVVLNNNNVILLPRIIKNTPRRTSNFRPLSTILNRITTRVTLTIMSSPFTRYGVVFVTMTRQRRRITILNTMFLHKNGTLFPNDFRPIIPTSTRFFRLNNLFDHRTTQTLPNLCLPLRLRPLTRKRTTISNVTPKRLRNTLFSNNVNNDLARRLPTNLRLPTRLTMRTMNLLRKTLLPRTQHFTTNSNRNLNTIALRNATITRPLRLHRGIGRQRTTTTYDRRHTTRRLLRNKRRTKLTRRGGPNRPLRQLLSPQHISTRRSLKTKNYVKRRNLRNDEVHGTNIVYDMGTSNEIRDTRRLFRLHTRLFLVNNKFGRSRVVTTNVTRRTKGRGNRILRLAREPTRLFVLGTRKNITLKRARIFSPNTRNNRLLLLEPRRNHVNQKRQRNPNNRNLNRNRIKSSTINGRLLHNNTSKNAIKRARPRRLYLKTRPRRLLRQLHPTRNTRLVMTIRRSTTKFLLPRPRPLLQNNDN